MEEEKKLCYWASYMFYETETKKANKFMFDMSVSIARTTKKLKVVKASLEGRKL